MAKILFFSLPFPGGKGSIKWSHSLPSPSTYSGQWCSQDVKEWGVGMQCEILGGAHLS